MINQGLTELELSDLYLIECKIKSNKIEIFLDSDEGVSFLKCQKLSRWLEAIFDEKKSFGESYILDVSSAGVGSLLKFLRIKHSGGNQVRGVLSAVTDDIIHVTYDTKIKEGKKNKKVTITEQIKFKDIIESRIKISFN